MFTVAERERVRGRVLELAGSDARVVAGAEVGSRGGGGGDRFSDLDLTFAVAEGAAVGDVLADWTDRLERELDAVHLFDVAAGAATYRVLLLPGCLQVDLSFAPASQFGARGPAFRLLFGEAVEVPPAPPPSPHHLFGLSVHHALRARVCIERDRLWAAEFWITSLRQHALELACLRHGVEPSHGRALDALPVEVLAQFAGALVRAVERDELVRALAHAVDGLVREAGDAADLAARVEPRLREITRG